MRMRAILASILSSLPQVFTHSAPTRGAIRRAMPLDEGL